MRYPRPFTFDEYLMVEREAEYKSEYWDGMIYAMSGGTVRHGTLAANLISALHSRLRGKGCRTMSSDVRVATDDLRFSAYPDLTVSCGSNRYYGDRKDVLLNPRVVVEVLSPSTEAYDLGGKFAWYQRIESLQEVVYVRQNEWKVEVRRRAEPEWLTVIVEGAEAELTLPSLQISIPLAEVYEDVEEF